MRATSSPAGAGIGAHGSGPSIGAAPGGRRKPGLKLSDMGISTGAPNGAPAPAGEMGSASPPGRRAGPPGKLSGATTNMMSTPFSNFSKIVLVLQLGPIRWTGRGGAEIERKCRVQCMMVVPWQSVFVARKRRVSGNVTDLGKAHAAHLSGSFAYVLPPLVFPVILRDD